MILALPRALADYGYESGIPDEWRDELAQADMIEKALAGLLSGARPEGGEA